MHRTLRIGLAAIFAASTAFATVPSVAAVDPPDSPNSSLLYDTGRMPFVFGIDDMSGALQIGVDINALEVTAGYIDPFAMLALVVSGGMQDLADNIAIVVNDWLQDVRLDPTLVDYAIVAMAGVTAPLYALLGDIVGGLRSAPHASARLAFDTGGARALNFAAG